MGTMDRNTLRWLLQKMEKEAQAALARDGSFLEALQALKWEVDKDFRVRAAMRPLRDRGLSVFTSFVPRIRIRLHAGETVLTLHRNSETSNPADAEDFRSVSQMVSDPLTQELRDAASAVVAESSYCRQLDRIVNEAMQSHGAFEQLAAAVERAGYELQICLDLSTYAQVREQTSTATQSAGYHGSRPETKQTRPPNSEQASRLHLSSLDVQFLKAMRISPD
jgi:hypothetical protein